jgi:hypothetical protein
MTTERVASSLSSLSSKLKNSIFVFKPTDYVHEKSRSTGPKAETRVECISPLVPNYHNSLLAYEWKLSETQKITDMKKILKNKSQGKKNYQAHSTHIKVSFILLILGTQHL